MRACVSRHWYEQGLIHMTWWKTCKKENKKEKTRENIKGSDKNKKESDGKEKIQKEDKSRHLVVTQKERYRSTCQKRVNLGCLSLLAVCLAGPLAVKADAVTTHDGRPLMYLHKTHC